MLTLVKNPKRYVVSYLDNVVGERIVMGEFPTLAGAEKCVRDMNQSNYVFLEPIQIDLED